MGSVPPLLSFLLVIVSDWVHLPRSGVMSSLESLDRSSRRVRFAACRKIATGVTSSLQTRAADLTDSDHIKKFYLGILRTSL
jgi:hypothetical protein